VQEVLKDLGVELDFWKLRMRPGKPLMFGTRGRTLVFGLPGNPVSALVTATVILKPALRALLGHADPLWPRVGVPTLAPLPPNGSRRHYMRGSLSRNDVGFLQVAPILETDSGHSSSLAMADALIVQPEDHPGAPPGEIVEVIPLNWG
jgi:molybdopterin molybdotransferase